jgi:hypothetical protein
VKKTLFILSFILLIISYTKNSYSYECISPGCETPNTCEIESGCKNSYSPIAHYNCALSNDSYDVDYSCKSGDFYCNEVFVGEGPQVPLVPIAHECPSGHACPGGPTPDGTILTAIERCPYTTCNQEWTSAPKRMEYQDETGKDKCKILFYFDDGTSISTTTFSTTTGKNNFKCNPGSYVTYSYNAGSGQTFDAACLQCPDGYRCPGGVFAPMEMSPIGGEGRSTRNKNSRTTQEVSDPEYPGRGIKYACTENPSTGADEYQSQQGETTCLTCPTGTIGISIDSIGLGHDLVTDPGHETCKCPDGKGSLDGFIDPSDPFTNNDVCTDCQPGHYSSFEDPYFSGLCSNCPNGTFQPNSRSSTCIEAAAINATPIKSEENCENVLYDPPPNPVVSYATGCIHGACLAGFGNGYEKEGKIIGGGKEPGIIENEQDECIMCPSGTYSTGGSVIQSPEPENEMDTQGICKTCNDENFALTDCLNIDPETKMPEGCKQCLSCPANSRKDPEDQTGCLCNPGYECDCSGSPDCICDNNEARHTCSECGYSCESPTCEEILNNPDYAFKTSYTNNQECQNCIAATKASSNGGRCETMDPNAIIFLQDTQEIVDSYTGQPNATVMCPPGTSFQSTTNHPVTNIISGNTPLPDQDELSECIPCTGNTINPNANLDPNACKSCDPGTTANASHTACSIPDPNAISCTIEGQTSLCCDQGYYYKSLDSARGVPENEIPDLEGECIPCPISTYKRNIANTTIEDCLGKSYCAPQTGCTRCPHNSGHGDTAETTPTNCICRMGFEANQKVSPITPVSGSNDTTPPEDLLECVPNPDHIEGARNRYNLPEPF